MLKQCLINFKHKYYGIALLEHLSGIRYISKSMFKGSYDILHIGVMSNIELKDFISFLRSNDIEVDKRKRGEKPFIVLGGRGIENATINKIADAVVYGEADDLYRELKKCGTRKKVIETIIEKKYVDSKYQKASTYNIVEQIPCFSWDYHTKEKATGRGYIEIGRGCSGKCLFCDLGWTRFNVSQKDLQSAKEDMSGLLSRDFTMLIPDMKDYENVDQLLGYGTSIDKTTHYSSEKLINKKYLAESKRKTIRWGIEGLSERLRRAVLKPITNKQIINSIYEMQERGQCQLKFFIIPDLPLARESDFEEFVSLLDEIAKVRKNLVLRIKFSSFEPDTRTPLRYAKKELGAAREVSRRIRKGKKYGFVLVEPACDRRSEIETLIFQRVDVERILDNETIKIEEVTREQTDNNICFDLPLPKVEKYYSIYQKYKNKLGE